MNISDHSSGTATPIKSAFQLDGEAAAPGWSGPETDGVSSEQHAAAPPHQVSGQPTGDEGLLAHAASREAIRSNEMNQGGVEPAAK